VERVFNTATGEGIWWSYAAEDTGPTSPLVIPQLPSLTWAEFFQAVFAPPYYDEIILTFVIYCASVWFILLFPAGNSKPLKKVLK